ncbi:MAG: PDZ domain-containing protein [Kangiellaceae bacterium]
MKPFNNFYRLIKSGLLIITLSGNASIQASDNQAEHLQPLPTSTMLGVRPVSSDAAEKVTVQAVAAGSSAAEIGILVQDKLIELDGKAIKDFDHLIQTLANKRVGDQVSFVVDRNGKLVTLTGKMKARTREKSDIALVDYATVYWNNQRIRTITYTPQAILTNNQKAPAIFYLQGYTCGSIDYGFIPKITTLQLIKQFVEAGFIVYRAEKLGVGDSRGNLHCNDVDFTTEVAAFTASLRKLKSHKNVNANQIYLWGHSLGVLAAPAIAKQEKVAGIIGYGGVHKSWHDYMLDIYSKQATLYFGTDEKTAQNNLKMIKPFIHDWLKSDRSWADLLKHKEAINSGLLPISGTQIFSRHYSFFRDLNQYDFKKLWQELQIPTLMIHGSLDIQAISKNWAFDIANSVNKGGSNLGKALVIENAEHALMSYKNIQENLDARANGQYNPGRPEGWYEAKIGETTIEWIKNLNSTK